jgi:hypothetical protein
MSPSKDPRHMISSRWGCSSIKFRHEPLPEALCTIGGLSFEGIDLGALPGVCDHVPCVLDDAAVLGALEIAGYTGHFSFELETRDVTHEQRPEAARAAAEYISSLL